MSWGPASIGLYVANGVRGDRNLNLTSISTVFIAESPGDPLLRMYFTCNVSNVGTDNPGFDTFTVDQVLFGDVGASNLTPASSTYGYIKYLDSDADGNFNVDESMDTVPQTWIAALRDMDGWTLATFDGTSPSYTSVSGEALYTDPCVVAVPSAYGGGYLMLLGRRRHDIDDLAHFNESSAGATIAELGISDIIAYWSDNLEFNDPDTSDSVRAVKGPVLLVDSLDALPGANFRVFAGVPTAAFHHDPETGEVHLYVYYTVDFPETAYLNIEDSAYQAAIVASDYSDWFPPASGAQPKGFTACKRFDWDTLVSAFTDAEPEPDWVSAVNGDLLGRVHIWVARPSTRLLRRATELLVHFDPAVQRCTDPEVERIRDRSKDPDRIDTRRSDLTQSQQAMTLTSKGLRRRSKGTQEPGPGPQDETPSPDYERTLSLYFRAVPSQDKPNPVGTWRDGHGFWRATAIPDGTLLQVTDYGSGTAVPLRTTVYGVDFVVAPPAESGVRHEPYPGKSRDMVAPADYRHRVGTDHNTDPTDPDVVQVTSGSQPGWWVYGGQFGFPDGSAYTQALGRVIGDEADGEHAWQDAWTFT